MKDHFLLRKVDQCATLEARLQLLSTAVTAMGDKVVVRLGLSRPFQGSPQRGPGACWVMADGFFSLQNPEP